MFLKNKNIIFKIGRLKVTDYAALNKKTVPLINKAVILIAIESLLLSKYT